MKFPQGLKRLLPHLTNILATMLVVLLIMDYYNPFMDFLDNSIAAALQWALCILTITLSVATIYRNWRSRR